MMEKSTPTLKNPRHKPPTKTRVLAFHVLAWVLSPTGDRRKGRRRRGGMDGGREGAEEEGMGFDVRA
jgi:hypothetical protein